MAVEVDGGVEHLARHQRRQCAHIVHVVNVIGTVVSAQALVGHHVVDDLVKPILEPVLVPADQILHVRGHRNGHVFRILLKGLVGGVEFDDRFIPQDDTDPGIAFAGDFERAELEGLDAGHGGLRGRRTCKYQRRK